MKRGRLLRFIAYTCWYAVICAVVGSVLFVYAFNFDSLKPQIEAQTSEWLQQKVHIKGTVEPGILSFHPALVLHKVEIGSDIKADTVTVAIQSRDPLLKVLVHADGFKFKGQLLGDYDIPVTAYATGFEIHPLKGELNSSKVEGNIKYIKRSLHIDGDLKDIPLARLAAEAEGKADIKLELDGKGDDLEHFTRTVDGRVTLTSGSGKLTNKSLNFWSRDLIRSFLPGGEEATKLNCAILDFDIQKGIATSRALVIDTDENTIIGKGSLNLDKETVDLVLKPNPKDISLVNFATPVRVTGPFNDTTVTPEAGGMLKKLGGIMLDAVNPAFALLPVLESGFDDYHGTCSEILKQKRPLGNL